MLSSGMTNDELTSLAVVLYSCYAHEAKKVYTYNYYSDGTYRFQSASNEYRKIKVPGKRGLWLKLAEHVNKNNADPLDFMAAQFYYLDVNKRYLPGISQFLKEDSIATYKRYNIDAMNDIVTGIKTGMHSFYGKLIDLKLLKEELHVRFDQDRQRLYLSALNELKLNPFTQFMIRILYDFCFNFYDYGNNKLYARVQDSVAYSLNQFNNIDILNRISKSYPGYENFTKLYKELLVEAARKRKDWCNVGLSLL